MTVTRTTALSGVFLGIAALSTAQAYSTTANLAFSWATAAEERVWISGEALGGQAATNTLTSVDNGTYLSTLGGHTLTNYANPDFASTAQCDALVAGLGGTLTATRKYGCRYTDASSSPIRIAVPVSDIGAAGPSASGTVTITDTTMTGILTIVSTTDEPIGGTATSIGNGANGYNLRIGDGSPFVNAWQGITTQGTYTLNLTGTFTATSWEITGGTARFSDPGFLCQQTGGSTPANILCAASSVAGGYGPAGEALSWGWDLDGGGPGTDMGEIDVRGPDGELVSTLSGVIASLAVDGHGNITTNSGEIRRAAAGVPGNTGIASCGGGIVWDSGLQRITCGQLTAANLIITGIPPPMPYEPLVPAPPAVWLLGTGLAALLGYRARRSAPRQLNN